MFLMAALVAVVGIIGFCVAMCKRKRRYDFNIDDPPNSLVVDKTEKSISGNIS